MTGKWVVQRFERDDIEYSTGRNPMCEVGEPRVCKDWQEACEAATLAIGPNCLNPICPSTKHLVFERDNVVVLVYMKLDF